MKKLMITAAALMMACAAYGQGQFLFNSHDTAAGNVLSYVFNGAAASDATANLNLAVFAGPTKDISTMTQLTPLLPLNNPAGTAKAGYPNPILQTFSVPTAAQGGGNVWVAFEAFHGTSLSSATEVSPVIYSSSQVALTATATQPPNEVAIGNNAGVVIGVPEPTTLALGFLGLGTLLMFRRRS